MMQNELIARLVAALKAIERFGHNEGHARGYTCANMAAEALEGVEDTYLTQPVDKDERKYDGIPGTTF